MPRNVSLIHAYLKYVSEQKTATFGMCLHEQVARVTFHISTWENDALQAMDVHKWSVGQCESLQQR